MDTRFIFGRKNGHQYCWRHNRLNFYIEIKINERAKNLYPPARNREIYGERV